jgi:hypothetical protein
MESWKGQLKAGTLLVIPELRPASNAVPISRYPRDWWSLTPGQEKIVEMVPRQPVGSQLVLLLNRGVT